jgi:hypothetical protein
MSFFLATTVGHSEGATRQREVTNDRIMHQNFALSVYVQWDKRKTKMNTILMLETADCQLISNSTLLIEVI